MVWWAKCYASLGWEVGPGLDFLEFFSGVGRIAKVAHGVGYAARAYDIDHDIPPQGESTHSNMPKRSSFDMNGEASYTLSMTCIL